MSGAAEPMSISERMTEAISIKTVFTVHAFGLTIPVSDTVVATWIIMAILALLSWLATRRLKEVPSKPQILVEAFIGFVNRIAEENLGHHWRSYASFLGTIFLFLIVANLAPLISPVGGFGYEPPFVIRPLTRDINVTAAFAIVVILTVIGSSVRYKGFGGFLKSFAQPKAIMVFFNPMEYLIKPLSLALRLFGNILGAYIIMQLLEAVVPVVVPPVFAIYFDIFDGLIQAVVFSFLSTIYIAEAIE
ncbi:MAG TPA: F0F1 ATP synthase subunit A [Rectinemataceae bacterium]|nr:F0F1 ATP synthase subunit A [Rectinemataceae bacterium]